MKTAIGILRNAIVARVGLENDRKQRHVETNKQVAKNLEELIDACESLTFRAHDLGLIVRLGNAFIKDPASDGFEPLPSHRDPNDVEHHANTFRGAFREFERHSARILLRAEDIDDTFETLVKNIDYLYDFISEYVIFGDMSEDTNGVDLSVDIRRIAKEQHIDFDRLDLESTVMNMHYGLSIANDAAQFLKKHLEL